MEASHKSFIESLKDERIGGRYVIERVLRAGGMGVVVAGRYPELDQEVAIKFMLPELASHEVLSVRFLREARLAARVKSPHFVRIFDFGRMSVAGPSSQTSGGVPYIVMEMLSGRDLRDELEARGKLPITEAIDYVLQAAVGIAEIHTLGFVHRDLKPSNLFLAHAAGTLTVKVLDFGISKESKAEQGGALTSTGHMIGTAQYMAPEQIRESKVADVRSDIWALGVILYELMTMSLPFGADSEGIGEIMGLILHTEPVPPRKHLATLPPALESVILKCLRREADERYADVGELAEALRPFAAPASLPRIDTIHQALGATGPGLSDSGGKSHGTIAIAHTVEAPTGAASPAAKRENPSSLDVASAGVSSPSVPSRETSMTSTGAAREKLLKQSSSRLVKVAGIGGVGLLAVAAIAVALSRSGAPSVDGTPTSAGSSAGANAPGAPVTSNGPTPTTLATNAIPAPAQATDSAQAAASAAPTASTPSAASAAPNLPSAPSTAAPAAAAPRPRPQPVSMSGTQASQPGRTPRGTPSSAGAHNPPAPAGISLDQLDRK